jgi:hypothetical protein
VESIVLRGKYHYGRYQKIYAYAPFMFTSNNFDIKDDALIRRLLLIWFSIDEQIPDEKAKSFNREVKPKLKRLAPIGHYIMSLVKENPDKILEILDIENVSDYEDMEKVSLKLWELVYQAVGRELPDWLKAETEEITSLEDYYEDMREKIREIFRKEINEAFLRYVKEYELPFEERIKEVLEKGLITWLITGKRDRSKIIITPGVLDVIERELGIRMRLKDLAAILKWRYYDKHSYRDYNEEGKVKNTAVIIADTEEFIEFVAPPEEFKEEGGEKAEEEKIRKKRKKRR